MFTIKHLTVGSWYVCYASPTRRAPSLSTLRRNRQAHGGSGTRKLIGIVLTHCHGPLSARSTSLVEHYGCWVACGTDVDEVSPMSTARADEEGVDYTVDHAADRVP